MVEKSYIFHCSRNNLRLNIYQLQTRLEIMIYLKQYKILHTETTASKVHAYRMIIVVIIVFGISWLPLHVHNIISLYGRIPEGRFYEVLRVLWYCMAYGNSLVNPFIYAQASLDFRRAFRNLFILSSCCKKKDRYCDDLKISTHITLIGSVKMDDFKS